MWVLDCSRSTKQGIFMSVNSIPVKVTVFTEKDHDEWSLVHTRPPRIPQCQQEICKVPEKQGNLIFLACHSSQFRSKDNQFRRQTFYVVGRWTDSVAVARRHEKCGGTFKNIFEGITIAGHRCCYYSDGSNPYGNRYFRHNKRTICFKQRTS